ncbi:FecR family protein [Sphingobacterium phlebotomi]|uniref:FecR family protein n=1 Tax=Sphingobacterium phlebotomi TaxID=2605433 RepID=A0A5D4H9V1_9SPHI|nr:FecR family protein [Sphingobacterium phlebotomi]TYR36235.1 FecR family protein [Sphingobacterium phlebotomi]
MEKDKLYLLVQRYREGTITDQELKQLKTYIHQESSDHLLEDIFDELSDKAPLVWRTSENANERYDVIQQKINKQYSDAPHKRIRKHTFLRNVAATVLFVLMGITALLLKNTYLLDQHKEETDREQKEWSAIVPGTNKAKIVLENGQEIDLEKLADNTSVMMDGYSLTKNKKGEISYKMSGGKMPKSGLYNTIIVPRGGEYKLNLPDGTEVWLNAASSLRYPLNFGESARKVELTGEAYFSVVKKTVGTKKLPFIVQVGEQELEVLGTAFNVNSYVDKIKTTLVEGAVQLRFPNSRREKLLPNQQSIYSTRSGKIHVEEINPYYTIAWRSGSFAFNNAPLGEVLDCLSRWYDVSFEYAVDKESVRFTGSISRYENIEKLLGLIEMTNSVKFEVKERRIIVSR